MFFQYLEGEKRMSAEPVAPAGTIRFTVRAETAELCTFVKNFT